MSDSQCVLSVVGGFHVIAIRAGSVAAQVVDFDIRCQVLASGGLVDRAVYLHQFPGDTDVSIAPVVLRPAPVQTARDIIANESVSDLSFNLRWSDCHDLGLSLF